MLMSDTQSTTHSRAKTSKLLTERFLETVKEPGYYWDTLPGFGVRVGKNRKTFTVIRGANRERISLGLWPTTKLQDARKTARTLLASNARHGPTMPFLEVLEDFIRLHVAKLRTQGMERVLRKHFTWRKSLHLVSRYDIQTLLDGLEDTPSEANHAFRYLRTFFLWCVRRGVLENTPMTAMRPPYKEVTRSRILSDEELRAIWNACGDDIFSRNVKLLILTGSRKSEVQNLTVSGDTATLPAEHSKNGREHTFPLSQTAAALLDQPLTFNGWSKSKARLDKASGINSWTLHDLRRTYATTHARMGTPPHVIERLLNHVSGEVSGVAAIYNRHHYLPAMREAVDNYEKFFQNLLARA